MCMFGAKPLSEIMLAYSWLGLWEHFSVRKKENLLNVSASVCKNVSLIYIGLARTSVNTVMTMCALFHGKLRYIIIGYWYQFVSSQTCWGHPHVISTDITTKKYQVIFRLSISDCTRGNVIICETRPMNELIPLLASVRFYLRVHCDTNVFSWIKNLVGASYLFFLMGLLQERH